MSSRWLPRPPATVSLWPRAPGFEPAEPGIVARIAHVLGPDVTVERMVSSVAEPCGYYQAKGRGGVFFLKILGVVDAERHRRADAVARFLAEHGIQTTLIDREVPLDANISMLVYKAVEFSYTIDAKVDGAVLGRLLARVHALLHEAPMAAACRSEGLQRLALLDGELGRWRREGVPHRLRKESIASFVAQADRPFQEWPVAQMVHGDLNAANVLFPTSGGAPIIIDFEDSLVSWLSPLLDVAMAVQRLVLCGSQSEDVMVSRGRALLGAYAAEGGSRFESGAALQACLRWLCLRSTCLLSHMERSGGEVAGEEWAKFEFLAEQADAALPLLNAITDDR